MADIHNRQHRLNKNIEKLKSSELSDHNTELLLRFKDHLLSQDLSLDRVARYLSSFNTLSVALDFLLDEAEKEDEWMMLAPSGKDSDYMKNETNNPNVWARIRGDSIVMGLAFNQTGKVDKFKQILHGFNQEAEKDLRDALSALDGDWEMTVEQRWKWNFAGPQQERKKETFRIEEITESIDEIVQLIDDWREEGKRRSKNDDEVAEEKPTVNLPRGTIEKDEDEFRDAIRKIFRVYQACIDVKSESEIKKEKRELEEELESLQEKEDGVKETLETVENRISAGPTERMLEGLQERKSELEDTLQEIRERKEELEDRLSNTG